MPTLDQAIITYAGKSLLDKVNAGMSKIEYTRVVYSIDDFSKKTDEEIKNTVQINNQNIITKPLTLLGPDGETQVRVDGNNENLSEGIYIKTYVVFAKGDDGNEIIFAIEVSSHSDYLIGNNDNKKKPQSVFYVFKTKISETNNVVFSSYKDIYATLNDLSNTKKELQTNIDTKASIEQAQYNVIRELTDEDNLFHIDTNGKYLGNGINPKNSAINDKSYFIFEKNNFYATFTDNGGDRFIVADYSKGWIKIPNDHDMKQLYTQIQELEKIKFVENAEEKARNDQEPHLYKDIFTKAIFQGGGVGQIIGGIAGNEGVILNDVDLDGVTTTGIYNMQGSNTVNHMPPGATNFGYFDVKQVGIDTYQKYFDTANRAYRRVHANNNWSNWREF